VVGLDRRERVVAHLGRRVRDRVQERRLARAGLAHTRQRQRGRRRRRRRGRRHAARAAHLHKMATSDAASEQSEIVVWGDNEKRIKSIQGLFLGTLPVRPPPPLFPISGCIFSDWDTAVLTGALAQARPRARRRGHPAQAVPVRCLVCVCVCVLCLPLLYLARSSSRASSTSSTTCCCTQTFL